MSAQTVAIALGCLLALVLVAVWLSTTASRLDRLHIRLATAQASLDRQLVDRAAATADVAHSGALDPAGSLLLLAAADAARQATGRSARTGDVHARDAAESALSFDLRAVFGDAAAVASAWRTEAARPLLVELAETCDRVQLARRFHDDLGARTRAARSRLLVRWMRLAGHASWPVVVGLDDVPPAALLVAADKTAPQVGSGAARPAGPRSAT